MDRWITLTTDHLKAAGHGAIIDRAQTIATGGIDPVAQAIVKVTARVQRAVATGNVLDTDKTKIPASLEDCAVLLAIAMLARRIPLPLPRDTADAVTAARTELDQIAQNKSKVELADNPESQSTVAETGMKIATVNVPQRLTGRDRTGGL